MNVLNLGCLAAFVAMPSFAQEHPVPRERKEKVSYCIGVDLGKNFKMQTFDVSADMLVRGLKDALSGKKLAMSDKEMEEVMTAFQREMMEKATERNTKMSERNKKEGDAFLARNRTQDGVVTLPSGLQYKILKAGNGAKPTPENTVVCQYRGTLIDGKEFDSSYKRGEPATFKVGEVIKGWQEALQLMPAGSKWQLFVPAILAYGDRGAGADIGPGATLIFEVELLSVK